MGGGIVGGHVGDGAVGWFGDGGIVDRNGWVTLDGGLFRWFVSGGMVCVCKW